MALLLLGVQPPVASAEALRLELRLGVVAEGFEKPVFITGARDGSGDRLVVEQAGRIRLLRADGTVAPEAVLDISDRVLHHAERGLLGLAVHPRFPENGTVFVLYSRRDDGATVISRLTLGDDAAPPDTTELVLLVIPQDYTTHKGGMLAFDHDGMLLVGIGDGGSGNDPQRHGLDSGSLLGKLLRLDVDTGQPYSIPAGSGFAADPAARAEVHAIGLRNPWRFSVDRLSGDVYIGDVGQSGWEEVNVLPSGRLSASFGWSDMEGPSCLGDRPCDPSVHVAPAVAYQHDDTSPHCAVIGGYAYRGAAGALPSGTYLYGDHCSRAIWAVPADDLVAGTAEPLEVGRVDPALGQLVSFGEDDAGELYAVTDGGYVLLVTGSDPEVAAHPRICQQVPGERPEAYSASD
jgi:glucose/arabinose dehydrogenase